MNVVQRNSFVKPTEKSQDRRSGNSSSPKRGFSPDLGSRGNISKQIMNHDETFAD